MTEVTEGLSYCSVYFINIAKLLYGFEPGTKKQSTEVIHHAISSLHSSFFLKPVSTVYLFIRVGNYQKRTFAKPKLGREPGTDDCGRNALAITLQQDRLLMSG